MNPGLLSGLLTTTMTFTQNSCMQNERPMNTGARKLHGKFPSLTDTRVPRRLFLQFMGYNHLLSYACPVLAAPMLEMTEPEVIR